MAERETVEGDIKAFAVAAVAGAAAVAFCVGFVAGYLVRWLP